MSFFEIFTLILFCECSDLSTMSINRKYYEQECCNTIKSNIDSGHVASHIKQHLQCHHHHLSDINCACRPKKLLSPSNLPEKCEIYNSKNHPSNSNLNKMPTSSNSCPSPTPNINNERGKCDLSTGSEYCVHGRKLSSDHDMCDEPITSNTKSPHQKVKAKTQKVGGPHLRPIRPDNESEDGISQNETCSLGSRPLQLKQKYHKETFSDISSHSLESLEQISEETRSKREENTSSIHQLRSKHMTGMFYLGPNSDKLNRKCSKTSSVSEETICKPNNVQILSQQSILPFKKQENFLFQSFLLAISNLHSFLHFSNVMVVKEEKTKMVLHLVELTNSLNAYDLNYIGREGFESSVHTIYHNFFNHFPNLEKYILETKWDGIISIFSDILLLLESSNQEYKLPHKISAVETITCGACGKYNICIEPIPSFGIGNSRGHIHQFTETFSTQRMRFTEKYEQCTCLSPKPIEGSYKKTYEMDENASFFICHFNYRGDNVEHPIGIEEIIRIGKCDPLFHIKAIIIKKEGSYGVLLHSNGSYKLYNNRGTFHITDIQSCLELGYTIFSVFYEKRI